MMNYSSSDSHQAKFYQLLNTKFVLRPEGSVGFIWQFFIVNCLVLLGILVPYLLAFEPDNTSFESQIDYFSTCIFSLDIIVTLNSGIYVDGQPQMQRSSILKHYLKFWLWVDLLSTLPFEQIFLNFFTANQIKSSLSLSGETSLLTLMKLFKMIRLVKLRYIIMKFEDHIKGKTMITALQIFRSFMYLFLVAHFFACLMFMVSSQNFSPNSLSNLIESHLDYNGMQYSPMNHYIFSLYWAVVTMLAIGYGDISPKSTTEKMIAIFTMFISSIVFGYIIGNVGTIIEKLSSKSTERRDLLININKLMSVYKLPNEVRNKSREYVNYLYKGSNARIDLKELLDVLSRPLREEIFTYINGSIVRELKFLHDLPEIYIPRLSKVLKPQVHSPNYIIFTENQVSNSMYFITKGCADVIDQKSKSVIKTLSHKFCFGEIGLFLKKPRCATVKSTTFLEVLILSKKDLKLISGQIPEMKRKIEMLRGEAVGDDLTSMKIVCYLCKNIGHIAKNCRKMTEAAALKRKWLREREETQLISLGQFSKKSRIPRQGKALKIKELSTKNVWGYKRNLNALHYGKKRFIRIVKSYLANLPKISSNENSLLTELNSLLSQQSEISFYLNNPKEFELILSSSSDSDDANKTSKIRNVSFDTTLIESSFGSKYRKECIQ